uniref:RNA-dependent RNA polymerase n=1 Tax=Riboviria sp. TaxID=2585031 RepID=A0A514D2Y5_9VIRU|nr:MAG: RNA-dependent RNA polymerase [Riboviria sp.]
MPLFEVPQFKEEEREKKLSAKYGEKKASRMMKLLYNVLSLKDLVYTLFVKAEIYMGKNLDTVKPRMIWSCPETLLAKFSAEFGWLGKQLASYFSGDTDFYYCSGATPDDVGKFGAYMAGLPYLYESDVSNWDGSLAAIMLQVERYFLENNVVGMPEDFKFLMEHWGINTGESKDKKVKVKIPYGRRSGDLWTSMFNSMLNILIVKFVTQAKRRVAYDLHG